MNYMIQELIQYGLSEKEAETYISCLKIGQATANRIAGLMNLPRSTTYDILERLKIVGLITTIIIDNKTNFIASTPDVLLTSLNEKKNTIEKILPDLKEMHNKVGDRPIAEVFQGKIAIIKLLDEILDNAKSLKVLGSQGNALKKIGYHSEIFSIKRLEKKIHIKQILEESKEARKYKKKLNKYTELKFIKSFSNSREVIFLFDNYVYHIILQYEISAIKIKSKDHAKTIEIIFDELWEKATP